MYLFGASPQYGVWGGLSEGDRVGRVGLEPTTTEL